MSSARKDKCHGGAGCRHNYMSKSFQCMLQPLVMIIVQNTMKCRRNSRDAMDCASKASEPRSTPQKAFGPLIGNKRSNICNSSKHRPMRLSNHAPICETSFSLRMRRDDTECYFSKILIHIDILTFLRSDHETFCSGVVQMSGRPDYRALAVR